MILLWLSILFFGLGYTTDTQLLRVVYPSTVQTVYQSTRGAFVVSQVSQQDQGLTVTWAPYQTTTGAAQNCGMVEVQSVAVTASLVLQYASFGDSLYLLVGKDSQFFLLSYTIPSTATSCVSSIQSQGTLDGTIAYGFLYPTSNGVYHGVVDSKRDIYISRVLPSITTAPGVVKWNRTEFLQTPDDLYPYVVGNPTKAEADSFYDPVKNFVVFLDKTGRVYTVNLLLAQTSAPSSLSLVYAPLASETAIFVQDFTSVQALGLAAVSQATSNCTTVVTFDYTATTPSTQYNGTAHKQCKVNTNTVRSDGSSIYFVSGSFLWQIMNTTATVYYSAVTGSTISDYSFRAPESAIIVVDTTSARDLVFISRNTLEQVVPLMFPSIFHWTLAMQGSNYIGSLFFSVSDTVMGIGFGSPSNVTLARSPVVDYYFTQTISVVDCPGDTLILALTVGDEFSIEATQIILWDYSDLKLPLPVTASTQNEFVFADFITALTRVKNQIYAAFQQPEISSYSPWVPTDWSETSGLHVLVDFVDGTKDETIDAVLSDVAGVMNVWTERECGFRDYLVCKNFIISYSYSAANETKKRDVPIGVVFMVNGGSALVAGFWVFVLLFVGRLLIFEDVL